MKLDRDKLDRMTKAAYDETVTQHHGGRAHPADPMFGIDYSWEAQGSIFRDMWRRRIAAAMVEFDL